MLGRAATANVLSFCQASNQDLTRNYKSTGNKPLGESTHQSHETGALCPIMEAQLKLTTCCHYLHFNCMMCPPFSALYNCLCMLSSSVDDADVREKQLEVGMQLAVPRGPNLNHRYHFRYRCLVHLVANGLF